MRRFLHFLALLLLVPGCGGEDNGLDDSPSESVSPFNSPGATPGFNRGVPQTGQGVTPDSQPTDTEVATSETSVGEEGEDASEDSDGQDAVAMPSEVDCEPPCEDGECVEGICVSACDLCPEGSVCDADGICINALFLVCDDSKGAYNGGFEGTMAFSTKAGSSSGVVIPPLSSPGSISLTLECSGLNGTVQGVFSGMLGETNTTFTFDLAGTVDFEKQSMQWTLSNGTVSFLSGQVVYQASGTGVSTLNNGTQWEGTWSVTSDSVSSFGVIPQEEIEPLVGAGSWIMGIVDEED